jgi:hypothetical protein
VEKELEFVKSGSGEMECMYVKRNMIL